MIRINNPQYSHFLQKADVLRRSGSLCDAIISVKSETFRAHRLVLACSSRALAQQLSQGDLDAPVHCTLEYFSPRTFQQILDFTYTQTLVVSVDDLHQLLRAAQLLEMQPLEEQCQKQLDTLEDRTKEEDKRTEVSDVKEQNDIAEEAYLKKKGSSVQKENLQDKSSPQKEASDSIVSENFSPPDSPCASKMPKLSLIPATTYHRDSVITRPVTNMSSFSSPWSFSNMWNSVSALRRIAANYPGVMATNQPSPAHPINLSAPHMLPLLGPHFQPSVYSSVRSHSAYHSRYAQNLYAGSAGMRGVIKQGLLKRSKPSRGALPGPVQTRDPSYLDEPKAGVKRDKDSQHCSASLLRDPGLRDSLLPGEAHAGFRGRGDVVRCEQQPHRRDNRGEKPYQCQHCPKKFSLKHQLDTHHRVHTGEKPFECRLCGQRSRDYSAMIKHLRTHDGAAPYQCTVCLEFRSSLVAMQRHIKCHPMQDFPPDWSINSTYLYTSHI